MSDPHNLPMSPGSYESRLTYEQIANLIHPLDPRRVGRTQGNSNMEAYDIRAELNRIFGFAAWDGEALQMIPIHETFHEHHKRKGQQVYSVAYRCQYRLRVYSITGDILATYTEWAMGDAQSFPVWSVGDAHDFAMKTAESQALKRCAINLGDQYGLCLYRGGGTDPVVGWTLAQAVPPEDPLMTMKENRETGEVTPETDPDHGRTEQPPVEGEVMDNGYAPPETPPEDKAGWTTEWNRARTYGPVGFIRFISWCYAANAPQPVKAALPGELAKLNARAEEQGIPTANYDFGGTTND